MDLIDCDLGRQDSIRVDGIETSKIRTEKKSRAAPPRRIPRTGRPTSRLHPAPSPDFAGRSPVVACCRRSETDVVVEGVRGLFLGRRLDLPISFAMRASNVLMSTLRVLSPTATSSVNLAKVPRSFANLLDTFPVIENLACSFMVALRRLARRRAG